MIKILHNLALFGVKKRHFFRQFFSAKIFFKILTSVPADDEEKGRGAEKSEMKAIPAASQVQGHFFYEILHALKIVIYNARGKFFLRGQAEALCKCYRR
jgi:hypothetical protein